MKKLIAFFMCFAIVFLMSACKKSNVVSGSDSASIVTDSAEIVTENETGTSSNSLNSSQTVTSGSDSEDDNSSNDAESEQVESNGTANQNSNQITNEKTTTTQGSYEDIECVKSYGFKKINFTTPNSKTIICITMPEEWKLVKTNNGYDVQKNSKVIGNIATAVKKNENAVNEFFGNISAGGVEITHSIDRVNDAYTRTLCYNYKDESGNQKSIVLTIPYKELDSAAVIKTMEETQKVLASTEKNMGVLKIEDNRYRILILGNSFVNTSRIGNILQAMCKTDLLVEAHSRGYASIATYTADASMINSISGGNYSAVFMCGFYGHSDTSEFATIVNACESSNTKLAIFPAHNETGSVIENSIAMYPNVVVLNWKTEIDNFIGIGIDSSNFCIADSHKHSTPLAGYIGAHMIYRAIFNKIPETTSFNDVSKAQIDLLGDYSKSGSIELFAKSSVYLIE